MTADDIDFYELDYLNAPKIFIIDGFCEILIRYKV